MKRDLDLIRHILLAIEGGQKQFGPGESLDGSDASPDALDYHLHLLEEAGLIDLQAKSLSGARYVRGLTWAGHEFIDSVRDPEVWSKTKAGAANVGGWTLGLIKDLGTAYLKHVAKEKLGLEMN